MEKRIQSAGCPAPAGVPAGYIPVSEWARMHNIHPATAHNWIYESRIFALYFKSGRRWTEQRGPHPRYWVPADTVPLTVRPRRKVRG